jgi:hypothetical protein
VNEMVYVGKGKYVLRATLYILETVLFARSENSLNHSKL